MFKLEDYIEGKRKRFIIRRIIKSIPVIILASIIVFSLMRVGETDPARRILGQYAPPEQIRAFRVEHNLHLPFHIQYIHWMGDILQGDLGESLAWGQPIAQLLQERLPITLQLMGLSLLISVVLGITTGVIGALNHNTWIDYLATIQSLFWRSAPSFWVGLIFLLIFGLHLGWFPVGGYGTPYHLILPAFALGLRLQAIIARLTRSSMLSVLNKEYILTAKTKGLKQHVVIIKHALRNALIPVVTVLAMRLPWLFGGAMITEQVFNIPGTGRMIFHGVMNYDFIVVQNSVLIITFVAIIANLGADIAYTYVDPRIEIGSSEGV